LIENDKVGPTSWRKKQETTATLGKHDKDKKQQEKRVFWQTSQLPSELLLLLKGTKSSVTIAANDKLAASWKQYHFSFTADQRDWKKKETRRKTERRQRGRVKPVESDSSAWRKKQGQSGVFLHGDCWSDRPPCIDSDDDEVES
jgi:hypothetical protein